MKILLTRSEPGASRMAEELARAGLQAVVVPLVAAEPTQQDFPADRYRHVIFVSEHAVSHAQAVFQASNRPLASIAPAAQWYAIGPATEATLLAALAASAAEASAPVVVVPEPARSEGLLEHSDLQAIAGHKVLIVAGVAGRALLPDTLRLRGASVESWLVYRRTELAPPAASLDTAAGVDVVVASSGQGLELLTRLWFEGDRKRESPAERQVPVCVPSPRVYNLALKLGWQKPVNCPGASAKAVLAGLAEQGLWAPGRQADKK